MRGVTGEYVILCVCYSVYVVCVLSCMCGMCYRVCVLCDNILCVFYALLTLGC